MKDILNNIMLSPNAAKQFSDKALDAINNYHGDINPNEFHNDMEKAYLQGDGTILLTATLPNGFVIKHIVAENEWAYQN